VIVLNSGGIHGPPGTFRTTELLCCIQSLLKLRAVKKSVLQPKIGVPGLRKKNRFTWCIKVGAGKKEIRACVI
jgi:hypothetical protein